VALIDLGLPGLDGFQVARQLRAALGDSILLIALSGYAQEEDRQRCQEAGFDAHLPKPVELEELNRVLASRK
jgi:CheY-like chemotaxis protein